MIQPKQFSPDVKRFIAQHKDDDALTLLLKYRTIEGVPMSDIADQLIGRKKARIKLPAYASNEDVLYPPAINIEQTSSEETAKYKSDVLSATCDSGNLVDLTGGFGIDTFAFAQRFNTVVHVEPDKALQQLAEYNHGLLGASNIRYVNATAEDYLSSASKASAVFIDPSRRNATKKVHSFHDCLPDITALQNRIMDITEVLLVKASPMHDIQLALREIDQVKRVLVVAADNEVRELLLLVVRGFEGEALISAVNLSASHPFVFDFYTSDEQRSDVEYSQALSYVYEPHVSLLKVGAFKLIAKRFGMHKLHVNTQLYTADKLVHDFPGRIFEVRAAIRADEKSAKISFPEGKANVIVRNYPATPEQLKKKLKLKDGGEDYLLAFTDQEGQKLLAVYRCA